MAGASPCRRTVGILYTRHRRDVRASAVARAKSMAFLGSYAFTLAWRKICISKVLMDAVSVEPCSAQAMDVCFQERPAGFIFTGKHRLMLCVAPSR